MEDPPLEAWNSVFLPKHEGENCEEIYKPSPAPDRSTQPTTVLSHLLVSSLRVISNMESQKSASGTPSSSRPIDPALASCRKKKSEDSSFIEDLKDHMDEFVHASMEEHKTCFTKTIKKMFGMSKVVAERSSAAKEVESHLPLQTSLSE